MSLTAPLRPDLVTGAALRQRSHAAVRCVAVALCMFATSGCQSLIRPSAEKRAASGVAAFAEVRATREELLRSTYLTWGADEDPEPTFTTKDGGVSLDFKTPTSKQAGFAVAIDRDGYLLTAAHVLRKHLYVVGFMDGEIRMMRASPVKTWHNGRHGEEYGVVRVDAVLDRPLSLKPTAVGARLLSVGRAKGGAGFQLLGGTVRERRDATAPATGTLLVTDVPLWYGDSGGPAFDADGNLLGIATGFWWGWREGRLCYERYMFAPDPAELGQIVRETKVAMRSQRK